MSIRGFVILAACLAVTTAQSEEKSLQSVLDGINQFSSAFYKEVSGNYPGNLATCPISTSILLAMAGYGASGETGKELTEVLHLPEVSVGKTGYSKLIESINAFRSTGLRLGSKIFIDDFYPVKPTFLDLTENTFKSPAENLDFLEIHDAVNRINQWAGKETNSQIQNLVTPGSISIDTRMILASAVYFKGTWIKKFDFDLTRKRPFYVSKTKTKDLPTMSNLATYRYGVLPELKASFVELPYAGEELSMIIILPDEVDGLAQLEKKLANQDLTELVKKGEETEVLVSLPKFKIESTINFVGHLKKLGIKKAFDILNSDFTGISDVGGAYINYVIQKILIEVNEEGSLARGAAAVVPQAEDDLLIRSPIPGLVGSAPPRAKSLINFVVERPFFYSIVRVEHGRFDRTVMPLFEGHVTDP